MPPISVGILVLSIAEEFHKQHTNEASAPRGYANWVDAAFWTDVLDERFWGPTDSYTQVNLGLGVRFNEEKATFSLTAQNVFDEEVLQHVFGDIIGRKVSGQLLFRF